MDKQAKNKPPKLRTALVKIEPHIFDSAKRLFIEGKGGGNWQALLSKAVRDFVLKELKK